MPELDPSKIRYVCKNCGQEGSYLNIRNHRSKNPACKEAGFTSYIKDQDIAEALTKEENENDEPQPVLAEEPPPEVKSSPTSSAKTGPKFIKIPPRAPEPSLFTVRMKLPVVLWAWYDWFKKQGYEGDFHDWVAECMFSYLAIATREYCTECGAAVDRCPHCSHPLPGIDLAVVPAGVGVAS